MRKSTPRNKHAVSVLLTTISIFYSSLLDLATVGIFDPEISPDYPTTLTFGPKYFESYHTFPDVNFVHGYNLGRNSSAARNALIESVPYACKALRDGKLLYWELGNEPDLYSTSAQGAVRPPNWNERWYVRQWLHWTREIREAMEDPCPSLAKYKYGNLQRAACLGRVSLTHPPDTMRRLSPTQMQR